ncbi:hypothetical protein D9M70_595110 [compost metagenome]
MAAAGVGQHPRIGGDQRIHSQRRGLVDRTLPACPAIGLGIGIDRDIELPALLTDQLQAAFQLLVVEIQARKMTGIGVIAKADINGVSTLSNCSLEGRQAACGTNQLHENSFRAEYCRAL